MVRLMLATGVAWALAPADVAAARTGVSGQPEQAVLAAEDALFAADVHRDVAAIDRGFADEAMFVHANGMVQSKADYLRAAAAPPRVPVTSVTGSDRVVRIFGDIGVVRGSKTVIAGTMRLSGTYLSVYVRRDRRWQLLDQQSSPEPRAPGHMPTPGGAPTK